MFRKPSVDALRQGLNLQAMRVIRISAYPTLLAFLLSLLLLSVSEVKAQPPLLRNFEYVESYSLAAVEQMLTHGIPASVTLAQAILESSSGTSNLARRSNNHFGIKCHVQWHGDTIVQADDTLGECFRSYESIMDSYTDHSLFLRTRARYAALFQLGITDYKGWCTGLKKAGYATFPRYAEVLITLIENLNLYELDGPSRLLPKSLSIAITEQVTPKQLKPSPWAGFRPGLYQLAENDALFLNEQDVHLPTLSNHTQNY